MSHFYLVSETALSNVIFMSMCKVHLNGLNLTEVIITNAASVRGIRTHIAILSDGTVVPCCLDGNGVMALGNILDTPLSDILESDKSKAFVQGFNDKYAVEPLCRHCSFKERFSHKI